MNTHPRTSALPDSLLTGPQAGARRALRGIALFECLKGVAALAALLGVLDLMHHDVRHLAITLIGRFGLDPEAHYPSLLLHYADLLPGANVPLLVLLAAGYIGLRFAEAWGLWYDRAWGEWLGALSGGLYVPFELRHLAHRPGWINAAVLAGNVFVVAFLAYRLWLRRNRAADLRAAGA
jgi:uncharacterized membrane protein (DUF2068 family)